MEFIRFPNDTTIDEAVICHLNQVDRYLQLQVILVFGISDIVTFNSNLFFMNCVVLLYRLVT